MRSLEAASLTAAHVERRPPSADAPAKTGDLSHLLAELPSPPPEPVPVTAAPAAETPAGETPTSETHRVWPVFPVHHEERRRIEARGECAPVTHADLMWRLSHHVHARSGRKSATFFQRLVDAVLRVFGRTRPQS